MTRTTQTETETRTETKTDERHVCGNCNTSEHVTLVDMARPTTDEDGNRDVVDVFECTNCGNGGSIGLGDRTTGIFATDAADEDAVNATTVLSADEEREAFYRHVFMGETMADVGDVLDVSASTVSKIVQAFKSYDGSRAELEKRVLGSFTDDVDPRDDDGDRRHLRPAKEAAEDDSPDRNPKGESTEDLRADGGVLRANCEHETVEGPRVLHEQADGTAVLEDPRTGDTSEHESFADAVAMLSRTGWTFTDASDAARDAYPDELGETDEPAPELVTDGGTPEHENETVTDSHVAAEFGEIESGLSPTHESRHRADFRYVNDARNHVRSLTALHLPEHFPNGDDGVRFTAREFAYSWPHTHRGEEKGDEWRRETVGPSLTARLAPDGTVTEWGDGSACDYDGLSWRDAARYRFARTVARRFSNDEIAHDAHDYAHAVLTGDESDDTEDEHELVADGGTELPADLHGLLPAWSDGCPFCTHDAPPEVTALATDTPGYDYELLPECPKCGYEHPTALVTDEEIEAAADESDDVETDGGRETDDETAQGYEFCAYCDVCKERLPWCDTYEQARTHRAVHFSVRHVGNSVKKPNCRILRYPADEDDGVDRGNGLATDGGHDPERDHDSALPPLDTFEPGDRVFVAYEPFASVELGESAPSLDDDMLVFPAEVTRSHEGRALGVRTDGRQFTVGEHGALKETGTTSVTQLGRNAVVYRRHYDTELPTPTTDDESDTTESTTTSTSADGGMIVFERAAESCPEPMPEPENGAHYRFESDAEKPIGYADEPAAN